MMRERRAPVWSLGASVAAALTGLAGCRSARLPTTAPAPAVVVEPAAAPRPHNTLRWKTNEVSNFGYDIFRSESEAGPFVKVNARPVPGTLKPGKVQTFEYEDDTIDPHKDYWYYVESITLTGERLKFTPTLKAPAKIASPSPRD